jgi:hypothetical protein
MAKVLFMVSGATYWVLKDGTRYATGYWAEEFAKPYAETGPRSWPRGPVAQSRRVGEPSATGLRR